jgi:LacI family transcriptional regulator
LFDKRPLLRFNQMTMTKITIQDVAQRAGVSVATIDRVLNRRPGVRSQTVEKVESAIRELNY